MLNSRLVRQQDAQLHFEVMAYLIREFGAPPRPPVPSPLHKAYGYERLAWSDMDTCSIFDWAETHFDAIKSECHMEGYNTHLLPNGEGLDADEIIVTHRLDALAAGRTPYGASGTTPILYDPRDCEDPGHFAATVTLQLADLRLSDFDPHIPFSELMRRMATLTAAVYNRQGFVLAQLPGKTSSFLTSAYDTRAVPHRIVVNTLCFATCLALRVRRQSAEQIIATYGRRMTKSFRRKVRQACRQIDTEPETLAVLQMLAEPTVRRGPGHKPLKRTA